MSTFMSFIPTKIGSTDWYLGLQGRETKEILKFRFINAALVVLVLQEIKMGDDTLWLKNVSDN